MTTPVNVSLGSDRLQRVTSKNVAAGSKTLFSQTQTYDNVGNVLAPSTTVPTITGSSLTEKQSYCYDALSHLVWAGNSGTPTGGDHCGSTPGGSSTPTYAQSFSYDTIDRLISGSAGTLTYTDLKGKGNMTLQMFPRSDSFTCNDSLQDGEMREI